MTKPDAPPVTADFSLLRDVQPQANLALLIGPLDQAEADDAQQSASAVPGSVCVKAATQGDVPDALFMALRAGPRILALAGTGTFVGDTLGGLLALQEEGITIPPVALLDGGQGRAASQAFGLSQPYSLALPGLQRLAVSEELAASVLSLPLIRASQGPQVLQMGLVYAQGGYAGDDMGWLYQKGAVMKRHMLPNESGDDMARIAPDVGGSLSTYVYGTLVSALPLPLLASMKARPEKPLRFLVTERARKARMAAMRAFGGQTARAQPFHGVHLRQAAALSMRLPGPHEIDGAILDVETSFNLAATAPLPFVSL